MRRPREPLTRAETFQLVTLTLMMVLFVAALGWLLVDKGIAGLLLSTALVLSMVTRVAGHASRCGRSRRTDTSGLTASQGKG